MEQDGEGFLLGGEVGDGDQAAPVAALEGGAVGGELTGVDAGRVAGPALPPLLRSADLMVNVNQHEASAVTSIQAMACGTPVVASANGAHLDAVVDGTTGIVVEPLRPALLAQKIRALLAHPMQLEAFSVAATDRARSRYSWDRIAHETLAVYDAALAA